MLMYDEMASFVMSIALIQADPFIHWNERLRGWLSDVSVQLVTNITELCSSLIGLAWLNSLKTGSDL